MVAAATDSATARQEDDGTASVTDQPEEIPETADIQDEIKDESGEAETLKQAHSPVLPPAAEVQQHRLTHWPYRSWCKFCNLGRGTGEQHRRDPSRVHHVPIVGLDYWYITKGDVKRRDELDEPQTADGEALCWKHEARVPS